MAFGCELVLQTLAHLVDSDSSVVHIVRYVVGICQDVNVLYVCEKVRSTPPVKDLTYYTLQGGEDFDGFMNLNT